MVNCVQLRRKLQKQRVKQSTTNNQKNQPDSEAEMEQIYKDLAVRAAALRK